MVIRSRFGPQGPQRPPAHKWSVHFENARFCIAKALKCCSFLASPSWVFLFSVASLDRQLVQTISSMAWAFFGLTQQWLPTSMELELRTCASRIPDEAWKQDRTETNETMYGCSPLLCAY